MRKDPLPRLDTAPEIHQKLLEFCRLKPGEIWCDPVKGHRVGCLDATDNQQINRLCEDSPAASLAIQDPPYNLVAFETRSVEEYIEWCRRWIDNSQAHLCENSSFYVWLGADQNNGFQPLPEFMLMMRQTSFASPQLYHPAQSARLRHSKKLDVGTARIAFLYSRQPFLYASIYRNPQIA